jgi:hypothetical protein
MGLRKWMSGLFASAIERAIFARANHRYEYIIRLAYDFLATNKVEGDYLEFGCYRGRTFVSAWNAIARTRRADQLYAFDSFQGLPELEASDAGTVFHEGKYAMSEEAFRKHVEGRGVPRERYVTVPGFYETSLSEVLRQKLPLRKAALIYLDCDLYSSTREALAWCYPYLQTGTVLCFDDFFVFSGDSDKGQMRALREFLAEHADIHLVDWHLYGWHGKSFIVNRR